MARSLRHLTRRRLTPSETQSIFNQFRSMDDRTCAIMMGAMLDHSLERVLLSRMRRLSREARDRLFFGTGPLSSFSGKIQIAFALDIIDDETTADLDIIRDIRNAFGHAAQRVTFRNKSIEQRVSEMHGMSAVKLLLRVIRSPVKRHFESVRGHFMLTAMGYVKSLDAMRGKERIAKG